MIKKTIIPMLFILVLELGCRQKNIPVAPVINIPSTNNWKQQFEETLPLLGHRNWILIVDKAFPCQSVAGMNYILANDSLLPTLKYVLTKINSSQHVRSEIFRDKELSYITNNQVKGVGQYSNNLKLLFAGQQVHVLLHDSVFKKLDAEAKLFKILVIKTNETIPYSSVFIKLNCAYWNVAQEKQLRLNMPKVVKF